MHHKHSCFYLLQFIKYNAKFWGVPPMLSSSKHQELRNNDGSHCHISKCIPWPPSFCTHYKHVFLSAQSHLFITPPPQILKIFSENLNIASSLPFGLLTGFATVQCNVCRFPFLPSVQKSSFVNGLNYLANPGHYSVGLDVLPELRLCVEVSPDGLGKHCFHVFMALVGIRHPVQL